MSLNSTPNTNDSEPTYAQLAEMVKSFAARIAELEEEITRLRAQLPGGGSSGSNAKSKPLVVKANRPPKDDQAKKIRLARPKGSSRKRSDLSEATDTQLHSLENCPDCGHTLKGGWVQRIREVLEIPQIDLQVIHHKIMAYKCGVCNKRHAAKPDLSGEVIGKRR